MVTGAIWNSADPRPFDRYAASRAAIVVDPAPIRICCAACGDWPCSCVSCDSCGVEIPRAEAFAVEEEIYLGRWATVLCCASCAGAAL